MARKKSDPAVSAQELAKIGNDLIEQQGFNFSFNTCAVAEANHLKGDSLSEPRMMNYQLKDLAGRLTGFQILVKDQEAACGCLLPLPVLQVGSRQMTVVADHRPVKLIRPKEFYLDQIELVDGPLTKTIRKWYNHFDQPPIGISQDGKRIYFGTGYDDLQIEGLAIEMSVDGIPRFVSIRESDVITDREPLKNFPKDPRNSYLGFFRFQGKNVNYIVKFSYPCT